MVWVYSMQFDLAPKEEYSVQRTNQLYVVPKVSFIPRFHNYAFPSHLSC